MNSKSSSSRTLSHTFLHADAKDDRKTWALRGASSVASFLALLGLAACTATVEPTTTTPPPPASGCSADSTVSCVSGTSGWTCSGSSQPEDANPSLVCSTDVGTGQFCCSTSDCSYDSSVTCGSAVGYSCATGATPPDQADPSLVCSTPITSNNVDEYCCYTNATVAAAGATCAQDPSVTGCQPNANGTPSYGFSCTGSDSPDADFSGLTCSTGTAGTGGATDFCCVYN